MYPTLQQVKTRFLSLLDDPTGAIFVDPQFNTTATITQGSATIAVNAISNASGGAIAVGAYVSGAGIPSGTTVLGPLPTATPYNVTLSNPATASGSTIPVLFVGQSVFQEAFSEAYDALFNALLNAQCPRIRNLIQGILVPPGTLSLTPAQMGITDFADYEFLSERYWGSGDLYVDLNSEDRLTQRSQTDRLLEFVYENDTFYFVGATSTIDLQIKYESSGEAPIGDATQILIDASLSFLANYAVGVAGQRKGYDEIGDRCFSLAVGPRYHEGIIGGELFRIIQPRVRSMQHAQVAPKPYSASRRLMGRRPVPYVAAQQGTTGGGSQNMPVEFSTAAIPPTINGSVNGGNKIFSVAIGINVLAIYLNGSLLTPNVDYTILNNQWTMANAPANGSVLTAQGWVNYGG
jgi:hypothetical protein